MSGTITGALFCSMGVLEEVFVDEEEEEDEGTPKDSLSTLFIARTE